MFKNIIAPVQAWLLSQGKCVGCGRALGKTKGKKAAQVTCTCGRIYICDPGSNNYRRAGLHEVK